MNIEEVAKEDPTAIVTIPVDITSGIKKEEAIKMVKELGITDAVQNQVRILFYFKSVLKPIVLHEVRVHGM
jgi:succinyl-CoA synthetase beta subunit